MVYRQQLWLLALISFTDVSHLHCLHFVHCNVRFSICDSEVCELRMIISKLRLIILCLRV